MEEWSTLGSRVWRNTQVGNEEHTSGGTVSCIFPLSIAIIIVNVTLVSGAVCRWTEKEKKRKDRSERESGAQKREKRKENVDEAWAQSNNHGGEVSEAPSRNHCPSLIILQPAASTIAMMITSTTAKKLKKRKYPKRMCKIFRQIWYPYHSSFDFCLMLLTFWDLCLDMIRQLIFHQSRIFSLIPCP